MSFHRRALSAVAMLYFLLCGCAAQSSVPPVQTSALAPFAASEAAQSIADTMGYAVLFRFELSNGELPDGALPEANPLDVNGILYGTTWSGGTSDFGTVFSFNLATGA